MKMSRWIALVALMGLIGPVIALLPGEAWCRDVRQGSLVTETLTSKRLSDNRIGLDAKRSISVYLPPGYADGSKSYPVIYYFHSLFSNNRQMFADGAVQRLFDRAITEGVSRDFILVAADYSTPTVGSFFENSSTSGHWLDFTVRELIPFIDRRFRTLAHRDSRGLAGDMMGAYGALKLAMLYPELFSAVYALHPVATGTGLAPMAERPDWRKIHQAKSFSDLKGDIFSQVFLAMAQAYLPNPQRPPFYCDFMVELEHGEPKAHINNTKKLQSRFLLDQLLPEKADNLRQMRAIAFDWGRYDQNQDHVYANQAFTRKLDELGIEHSAEEYRGNSWNQNWLEQGRVYRDMLPFFDLHLVFTAPPSRGAGRTSTLGSGEGLTPAKQ